MRTAILAACVVAGLLAQHGQGAIVGRATSKQGDVLPGVAIVASTGEFETKAVTDREGRYRLAGLAAGTYPVTASLAGFVTAVRKGVTVTEGPAGTSVDFSLCPGALDDILFVVPGYALTDGWGAADVVARVRIDSTAPVRSECPTRNVVHTATVHEVLKGANVHANGSVRFLQEIWHREPKPYAVGQDLVVFLKSTPEGYVRAAGPYFAFVLDGERAVNFVPRRSMSLANLLADLHALARDARRP